MATPQHEESFLIALPMEMLDRNAVHLEDDHDATFSTRLTCKTLEAATFDRFADEFFHCPEYCVFNKRSLLHLQSLLSTSPRLAAKIRRITFTSSFFTNVNHTQVKLALNKSETNMDEAQIASIDAYNKQQYSMLHKRCLPSKALIRSVLFAFKAKCPGATFDLDLTDSIRSSIQVQVDVLEAVASLAVALNTLAIDVDSLGTLGVGEPATLLPGLLTCSSSLTEFAFTNTRCDMDDSEAEDQLFTKDKYNLLRGVLGSATALLDLTLDFVRDKDLEGHTQITSELIAANRYPMLQSLCLNALAITQVTLSNALTSWAGQLVVVQLHGLFLCDVEGEGWLDVLRTFTLMPKLRDSRLYFLSEGLLYDPAHRLVDLRHLKKGQRPKYLDIEDENHKYLVWNTRDNVGAGLQELLEVGLKYHDGWPGVP